MMERSCLHCRHCREIEAQHLVALEREKEEQARIEEERRQEETRADQEKKGIIHGDRYLAYSEEEIRQITDIEFLCEMKFHYIPNGQPPLQWEYDELMRMHSVICDCIKKLEK